MPAEKKYDRTYRPKSKGSEGPKKSVKKTTKGEPPNTRRTGKKAKTRTKLTQGKPASKNTKLTHGSKAKKKK
jgi:hypothetical protein